MSQLDTSFTGSRNDKNFSAGSMKNFMHGNSFQIKIILFHLLRGWLTNDNFELITEMLEAGNFDDVVYITTDKSGKKSITFLQAKHVQEKKEEIGYDDFVNVKSPYKKENFNLLPYFESFKQIVDSDNETFKIYEEKNSFIIFTNYGINMDNLKVNKMELIVDDNYNKFFHYNNDTANGQQLNGMRYKIKKNDCSDKIFKIETELHQLATKLAHCTVFKQKLELKSPIFSKYHIALKDQNILVSAGREKASFHEFFTTKKNDETNSNEVFFKFQKLFLMYFKQKSWETEKFIIQLPPSTKIQNVRYVEKKDDENLKKLAKEVADCILNQIIFQPTGYSNRFIYTLKDKVFQTMDNDDANFSEEFIKSNSNIGKLALKFREFFIEEYATGLSDEMILERLKTIKLMYDDGFANLIEEYDCELEEIEAFTEYISSAIKDNFSINEPYTDLQSCPNGRNEVNQYNLKKMAGKNRAIVYDAELMNVISNKKVLRFSTAFVTNLDSLPDPLKHLRQEMINKDVTENELQNIRFTIPNYFTEYEILSFLPPIVASDENDIVKKNSILVNEFLDKLILAVDQPDEKELTGIIKNDLKNLFLPEDIDLAYCKLMMDVIDWVKEKKVTSYNREKFGKTLNDLKAELSNRCITYSTSEFCKLLQDRLSLLPQPFEIIPIFMKNEENILWMSLSLDHLTKQILNDIKISSSRKVNNYFRPMSNDNYIFENLSSILLSLDDFIFAIKDPSHFNLVIIIDDMEESAKASQFYKKLCETENVKLKIIIITTKDYFNPFKTYDGYNYVVFQSRTSNSIAYGEMPTESLQQLSLNDKNESKANMQK